MRRGGPGVRRFVELAALAALAAGASILTGQTAATASPGDGGGAGRTPLGAELVVTGLIRPLQVTAPPGDRERLFVTEQGGLIRIVRAGSILFRPFLDLTELVSQRGFERGLLGMAFAPDFDETGRLYVNYTRREDHATMVVLYSVDPADPDRADPSSAVTVLGPVAQPFGNHNGGGLAFGPDGKLYIGMGDGGGGGDPFCNAQRGDTLLGKILRLDPDGSVPRDNPFVRDPEFLDAIWAYGLRNPWRFSFDRRTGDLYIADVGQSLIEEIDFQPAGSRGGENYGWNAMEGSLCFDGPACAASGPACGSPGLVLPVHEYDHDDGCSVTGGFVYRGCAVPDLRGAYVFGDFCKGTVWSLRVEDGKAGELVDLTTDLAPGGGRSIDRITSFGEDADGELHIVDRQGEIFRIGPDASVPPPAVDLGFATTRPNGRAPSLSACGILGTGGDALFRVFDAPPNARAVLTVSRTMSPTEVPGGILVPGPVRFERPFRTDGRGRIAFRLPGGGGPSDLFLQFVFDDPERPEGRSFSNALKATWRP